MGEGRKEAAKAQSQGGERVVPWVERADGNSSHHINGDKSAGQSTSVTRGRTRTLLAMTWTTQPNGDLTASHGDVRFFIEPNGTLFIDFPASIASPRGGWELVEEGETADEAKQLTADFIKAVGGINT